MDQKSLVNPADHETDSQRVEGIIDRIRSQYGQLEPALLHNNEGRGHRTYRLDAEGTPKYVLKIYGENFGLPDGIAKEVTDREVLRALFEQAELQHWVITEIIDFDPDANWSLAKYEQFQTLYELYKENRDDFRRKILALYGTIVLPLLQRLPHDTVVPGDYGLDDIGYRDGTFFFYDLEKNKTLLKTAVDIYSKLIQLYGRRLRAGDADAADFLATLLDDVRTAQQEFVDTAAFNQALADRLQSPVLQDAVRGNEADILKRFEL